ncbi:MAG: YitT family protein, partial [Eubacteriales bacterium]
MRKKHAALKIFYHYLLLFAGSVIAAIGLEIFLIPNNIIDGGIVGISIIASYLSNIPLGIFTFALNVPFLIVGYKQIGKTFLLSSLFAIVVFSVFVSILHPIAGLTNDVLLATVFGGVILGAGVGLILRNGGSLDGTEIV